MTDIFTLGLRADSTQIRRARGDLDNLADSAENADNRVSQMRETLNTAGRVAAAFGASVATAFGVLSARSAEAAREIDKLARLSNTNVEQFQRTAFAANTLGVEADKLADAFKDIQDRVGDFLSTGGGEMADFFERIAPQVGVTAENFRGLNGRDAMLLYIDSLERANLSQAEMTFFLEAMANDLTILQPLFENSGAELQRLEQRADELNLVLSAFDVQQLNEMRIAFTEAGAASEALGRIVSATLAPFVTDLTREFTESANQAGNLRDELIGLVEIGTQVVGVYADAGRVFEIVGNGLGALAFSTVESFNAVVDVFNTFSREFTERPEQIVQLLGLQLSKAVLGFSNILLETIELGINGLLQLVTDGLNKVVELVAPFADRIGLELEKINAFKIDLPEINVDRFNEQIDELTGGLGEIETIVSDANLNITAAWDSVLELLAEPLPSAGIEEWFNGIRQAIEQQRDLAEASKTTNNTIRSQLGETSRAEKDFARERLRTQVGAFQEITRFAIGAVDEQSKARERLHQLEQALTVVEIGLSLQKAGANALEAITSAFAADFPINFAAGAAMIGIMQGLGVFDGGSSSGVPTAQQLQDQQGTGTVFGSDAQSQSILNSQQRLEDIQIDQLGELRGIRTSINNLSGGIEQLTRSLVGGVGIGQFQGDLSASGLGDSTIARGIFGGLVGVFDPGGIVSGILNAFSNTSRELVDRGISFVTQTLGEIIETGIVQAEAFFTVETTKRRFFGLSTSSSTGQEFQGIDAAIRTQIGDIFNFIGDSVIASAEALGITTVSFVRQTIGNGFFDQEDFAEIQNQFGNQFFDFFGGFVAETETVVTDLRTRLNDFVVDIGQVSFEGLSGEEINEQLNAIFSQQADAITTFLVPGIEEFQRVGEGAFETLTRVAQEQVIFNDAIAEFGITLGTLGTLVQARVGQNIIELSGGIDRFQELTRNFFDEFLTEEERFTRLTDSLTGALEGLGLGLFENREQYRQLIESVDITTEAGQRLFSSLLELNPALDDFFDTIERQEADAAAAEQERLAQAQAEAEAAARALASEMQQLTNELTNAAQNALRGLSRSINAEQDSLASQLRQTLSSIADDFARQRELIESRSRAQTESLGGQLDTVVDRVRSLSSLSSSIGSALQQLQGVDRELSRSRIDNAISLARSGRDISGLDLNDALQEIATVDESQFATQLEAQRERARSTSQLTELRGLTEGQLSLAERNVTLLERQIETIEKSRDRQLEASALAQAAEEDAAQARFDQRTGELQAIFDTAQAQLDSLLGTESGVLSLTDAIVSFNDSIKALADQLADQQQELVSQQLETQRLQQENRERDLAAEIQSRNAQDNEDVKQMLLNINVNTLNTAKVLNLWDGDGQPETRSTA